MKNKVLLISLIALVCLSFAAPTEAATLAQKLKGKILLQVESNGEAWYVHPVTLKRHSLGRPDDAFKVMREQGLGISEEDYAKMLEKAPAKFAGRILLRVQAHGEAYYVHPTTLKLYFLGRPADAFKVMRELGLGIKNADLDQIAENIIDCGSATQTAEKGNPATYNCFEKYIADCQKVKMTNTVKIDLFGAISSQTIEYRLAGMQSDLCKLAIKITDGGVKYSTEAIKYLQDQGQTTAEIKKAEQEADAQAKAEKGKTGNCLFQPDKLKQVNNKWKTYRKISQKSKCSGSLASGKMNCVTYGNDWDYAETCSGDYFGDWSTIDVTACSVDSECGSDEHCFANACTKNSVWEKLVTCKNVTCDGASCSEGENACTQPCATCNSGTFSCFYKTANQVTSYKCVECASDANCASGYECKEYKCVKK